MINDLRTAFIVTLIALGFIALLGAIPVIAASMDGTGIEATSTATFKTATITDRSVTLDISLTKTDDTRYCAVIVYEPGYRKIVWVQEITKSGNVTPPILPPGNYILVVQEMREWLDGPNFESRQITVGTLVVK